MLQVRCICLIGHLSAGDTVARLFEALTELLEQAGREDRTLPADLIPHDPVAFAGELTAFCTQQGLLPLETTTIATLRDRWQLVKADLGTNETWWHWVARIYGVQVGSTALLDAVQQLLADFAPVGEVPVQEEEGQIGWAARYTYILDCRRLGLQSGQATVRDIRVAYGLAPDAATTDLQAARRRGTVQAEGSGS